MARRVDGIDFIIDDKAAHAAIRRMTTNVDDLRKVAWPAVLPAVLDAQGQWFGARGDGSWPALKPGYAKWKASHGGGNLLELTGDLRRSLSEQGAKWQKVTRGKRQLTLTTSDPVAHLHMKGKPKMAARSPLATDSPQMQKAIQDSMEKVARQWAEDFARKEG
jgi:hypothetical protein